MSTSDMRVPHVIGLDCGQYSQGIAIIETDGAGNPVSLLNGVSYIHDAGVLKPKDKTSRLAKRGVKRRARKRLSNRRRRLRTLDDLLLQLGCPAEQESPGDSAWQARARLVTEAIQGELELKSLLGLAVRHMARHRGARSAWILLATFLRSTYEPSDAMVALRSAAKVHDPQLPDDATQAQCVVAHANLDSLRIRTTALTSAAELRNKGKAKKDQESAPTPLLVDRFSAGDILQELRLIAQRQGMEMSPGSPLYRVAEVMFFMEDPRKAAKDRVAKDPLDRSQRRAFRASEAFQSYRIAGALTNLRVKIEDSEARRMTPDEVQRVFTLLNEWSGDEAPTWGDVADELGVAPISLVGISDLALDGEPLSSRRAPFNTTNSRLTAPSTPRAVRDWWAGASFEDRDALVTLLNNGEGEGTPEDIRAASLIATLPDAEDDHLAAIKLESGRAAYSMRTCRLLVDHILSTGDDAYEARREVFKIPSDWQPPAPALNEPTGNGAVDRVLMNTQRVLDAGWVRYGAPDVVNIEHVRDGFSSPATVDTKIRQQQSENRMRAAMNEMYAQQVRDAKGLAKDATVSSSDVRRMRLLERQNSKCGYCQNPLTFFSSELDHIVPRKGPGSTNRESNFMVSCGACNREKGNKVFALWAESNTRGVTFERVAQGVETWTLHHLYTGPRSKGNSGLPAKTGKFKGMTPYQRQHEQYRAGVISRLKRRSPDEADERSLESTAYMARELRRRVIAYYQAKGVSVTVGVYQGAVTAAARHASGVEKQVTMIGGKGKQRFDRRHHVLDAATIALMEPSVCTVLTEREQLRADEKATGSPSGFQQWDGSRTNPGNAVRFHAWLDRMQGLITLLDDALESDTVAVRRDLRLTLSGNPAHEETVQKYEYVPVEGAFSPGMVLRASSPQLWHGLVNQHDYSEAHGLAADASRTLRVGARTLEAGDVVPLFPGDAKGDPKGNLMVPLAQGCAAAGGDAINHARVYRIKSAKGVVSYGMVRVLATDLSRGRVTPGQNPITRPLTEDMLSLRFAQSSVRKAILSGSASLVGHLFTGDELELRESDQSEPAVSDLMALDRCANRWVVVGFEDNTRIGLRPLLLSRENTPAALPASLEQVIEKRWRATVNKLFTNTSGLVVRRDVLGVERHCNNPLRTSWSW